MLQISEDKESSLMCSESELEKIMAKCNKENDIEEDDQPLFIDREMEAVMCRWCPTWNGSQKVKVINQHTKASNPIKWLDKRPLVSSRQQEVRKT